ncbi:unnamed protein product [Rhodiola kirilowii]
MRVVTGVVYLLLAMTYNMLQPVEGSTYIVGDEKGWNLYTDYSEWTRGLQFHVGDVLLFKYEKGAHNVMQVNSTGYEDCLTDSSLGTYTSGNDAIRLMNAGQYWYVCGLEDHCDFGQKLIINVVRL